MKAISKQQHLSVIAALQQLNNLAQAGVLPADGFMESIHSLSERYSQYETLLIQLADCIKQYESMQKNIRVRIVGPALRKARRQSDKNSIRVSGLKVSGKTLSS